MSKADEFFGVTINPLVETPLDKKDRKLTASTTLIDHLKAIFDEPYNPKYYEKLTEQERRTFSAYMIHRFISSYGEEVGIIIANAGQASTDSLSDGAVYKYYHQFLKGLDPSVKRRLGLNDWDWRNFKYFKEQEKIKYHPELLTVLAKHFRVSKKEVFEYLELLYQMPDGIEEVKDIIQMYAYTDKEIKQLIKREEERENK